MIITSVEAHIAVRWALPSAAVDQIHAEEVSVEWQGRQVRARFLVGELEAMIGDLDVTAHPALRPWISTVLPTDGLAMGLINGPFQEPIVRVSLDAHVPEVSGFVSEGDDAGSRNVSYRWLSRVSDLVLDLSSRALQSVLDDAIEYAQDSAQTVDYRYVGPLCMADLVGAGIGVARASSGEEFSVPLLSRPSVGSRGAPPAHDHATSDVSAVGSHLGNVRRLYEWDRRRRLRLARGEWAESVVCLEAAIEQFLWSISESVMVEHGWTRADIEDRSRVPNLFSLLTFLQHHMHGNAGGWRQIRRDVITPVWKLRNDVIHRADAIDEDQAQAHSSSLNSLLTFLKPKIEHRRRQHPLTAYLWSPECLSPAEQAAVEQVTNHPDLTDTRDINDLMPWAFARAVDESVSYCQPVDRVRSLERARVT